MLRRVLRPGEGYSGIVQGCRSTAEGRSEGRSGRMVSREGDYKGILEGFAEDLSGGNLRRMVNEHVYMQE